LTCAPDPERCEEDVQERRVVRILEVLNQRLPVRRDALLHLAEHAQAATVEDAIEVSEVRLAEVRLERRRFGRK
jgi:predicted ATPase